MLYNILACSQDTSHIPQSTLSDVSPGKWYYNAINFLAHHGYIVGFRDNTFRPDTPITRAEITVLLTRKSGLTPLVGQVDGFIDVSSSHWAVGYIYASQGKDFVRGYPDGTFRPNNHATRAEAVVLLNRVLNPCPNTLPVSYVDLTYKHFAYVDILRASIVEAATCRP